MTYWPRRSGRNGRTRSGADRNSARQRRTRRGRALLCSDNICRCVCVCVCVQSRSTGVSASCGPDSIWQRKRRHVVSPTCPMRKVTRGLGRIAALSLIGHDSIRHAAMGVHPESPWHKYMYSVLRTQCRPRQTGRYIERIRTARMSRCHPARGMTSVRCAKPPIRDRQVMLPRSSMYGVYRIEYRVENRSRRRERAWNPARMHDSPPPCHSATASWFTQAGVSVWYRHAAVVEARSTALWTLMGSARYAAPWYLLRYSPCCRTVPILRNNHRMLCRQFRGQSGRWFNPTGANENRALLIPNRVAYKMAVPSSSVFPPLLLYSARLPIPLSLPRSPGLQRLYSYSIAWLSPSSPPATLPGAPTAVRSTAPRPKSTNSPSMACRQPPPPRPKNPGDRAPNARPTS